MTSEDEGLGPTRRRIVAAGLTIFGLMAMLSAFAWWQTDPGQQLPVHWNMRGEVDRYGSRFEAFAVAPLIWAGLVVLLAALPSMEPRRRHLAQSRRPWLATSVAVGALMLVVHTTLVGTALGVPISVDRVVPVALGLMLAVVGNYFGKLRSNFFIGVRTPWTLSSERSWRKTHRWAGRLFVLVGLLMVATAALPQPGIGVVVLTGALLLATLFLLVYSYLVWRGDPERG